MLKRCPARLTENGEHFALMTSFDLEHVDPRSRNLNQKDFLCGSTQPPNLVFLALLEAEIAREALYYMPPSRARISQTPSSARIKIPCTVRNIDM